MRLLFHLEYNADMMQTATCNWTLTDLNSTQSTDDKKQGKFWQTLTKNLKQIVEKLFKQLFGRNKVDKKRIEKIFEISTAYMSHIKKA